MPEKINNNDLDSFLKSHLKSVPERELSDNDEKQMISNIILKTAHQKSTKENIFSMKWIQAKEISRNVYDNFRIGRFQVLSPQFGLPLLLILAVSVFLIIKYSGNEEKKPVIASDKKETIRKDQELEIKENKQQDYAKLETDDQIQSIKLESITLVYSDRGSTKENTTIDKKRKSAFSVIEGVLQENGIEITKQLNDSLLISEWIQNIKDTSSQQRLVYHYNLNTTKVDVNIQKKTKEIAFIKKKNLEKIYKKIDAVIYQIIKLGN